MLLLNEFEDYCEAMRPIYEAQQKAQDEKIIFYIVLAVLSQLIIWVSWLIFKCIARETTRVVLKEIKKQKDK